MVTKKTSSSSKRWLKEHYRDNYVKQAKKRGFRSRSWFKLDQIQQKEKLFYQGMTVVDLGSAPGSWSQYVATKNCGKGRIIACDILPMKSVVGVDFIQGDFLNPSVLQSLLKHIGKNKKVDMILSDMSPNISGISVIDIPKSMHLIERVLDMSRDILVPGGNVLIKVFQGESLDKYLREVRSIFKKVKICKPDASRLRSREIYIVATGRKI